MGSKFVLRLANNPTIKAFKTAFKLKKLAIAPQHLPVMKNDDNKVVPGSFFRLNKWYNKRIGLDEVNIYLQRVAALEKELLITQEKRRRLNGELREIRVRANEVQDKIQLVDRKKKFDEYCELIKEERKVISLEHTASNKFQEYDQKERDIFTALTNATRSSQEKQRAQVEYTKYLGFILSITGSFLAFVYTTYRKNDLKRFIDQKLESISAPSSYNLGSAIGQAAKGCWNIFGAVGTATGQSVVFCWKIFGAVGSATGQAAKGCWKIFGAVGSATGQATKGCWNFLWRSR